MQFSSFDALQNIKGYNNIKRKKKRKKSSSSSIRNTEKNESRHEYYKSARKSLFHYIGNQWEYEGSNWRNNHK